MFLYLYTMKRIETRENEFVMQFKELLKSSFPLVLNFKADYYLGEDKGKRVWFKYFRRTVSVTHFYFYILDKNFGLFFIKSDMISSPSPITTASNPISMQLLGARVACGPPPIR